MEIRLDAVGIVVSSIHRSVEFYRLLNVPFAEPGDGDHHEATLPSGLRLMLDTEELVKSIDDDWSPPIGQRIGIAFHCGDAAGVNDTYQEVLDAGLEGKKEPWDAFWGQRYAQVQDPDGNIVDLFAPLKQGE